MTRRFILIMTLMLLGGCQTIGSDLADMAATLVPKTPGEAARMAANTIDSDERREGVILLSNATFGGDEIYVRLYREYAANEVDPIVRAVSVRALARHGSPEDAEIIASNLTSENVQVRWEAAKGLQRIHNRVVLPRMLAVLDDAVEWPDIRAALARGLGQYPEDRVFQGLIGALDARELAVNLAARKSLRTMTGQDFQLEAESWLSWYRGASRDGDAFAGAVPYTYPTYQRDETTLERLIFWHSPVFETPGPPAGLRHADERRTYEDSEGI